MEYVMPKIVFGLRHSRQYRFLDKAGHMADDVLSLNKTAHFLDRQIFEEIGWSSDRSSFLLQDPNKDLVLECNTDGIVLTCNLDGESEYTPIQVKNIFIKCVDKIINKTDAHSTINRIGIINHYLFKTPEDSSKFLGDAFLNIKSIGDPNEVAMKFVIKTPIPITSGESKHFDYYNAIFHLSSAVPKDEDAKPAFRLNLDYQVYFSPDREYNSSLIDTHFQSLSDYVEKLRTNGLAKVFSTEKANG